MEHSAYEEKIRKKAPGPMPDPKKHTAGSRTGHRRPLAELAALSGNDIFHLPRDYWETGCYFSGFSNDGWLKYTCGAFPLPKTGTETDSVKEGTHPMYVLSVDQTADIICPCTSRFQQVPYIPKGSSFDYGSKAAEKNTYVLVGLSYPASPEEQLDEDLFFRGQFPPEKLRKH